MHNSFVKDYNANYIKLMTFEGDNMFVKVIWKLFVITSLKKELVSIIFLVSILTIISNIFSENVLGDATASDSSIIEMGKLINIDKSIFNVTNPNTSPDETAPREYNPSSREYNNSHVKPNSVFTIEPDGGGTYNSKLGTPISIYDQVSKKGTGNLGSGAIHSWHYSTDGIHWPTVPNQNSSTVKIWSSNPGTVYLQDVCSIQNKTLGFLPWSETIYSTVATVNFNKPIIPSQKLSIQTMDDSDTVYVNDDIGQSTLGTQLFDYPKNANDFLNLEWSTNDKSTDTSIDPFTGLITVNNGFLKSRSVQESSFDISAKIGSTSTSKTIFVKKMLSGPRYVFPGQNGYFELKGDKSDSSKYTYDWYMQPTDEDGNVISGLNRVPLSSPNDPNTHLPTQVLHDNGFLSAMLKAHPSGLVYAQITEKNPVDPAKPQTIISNKVLTTVEPNTPTVSVNQKMTNNNHPNDNSNPLHDITPGSKLTHNYYLQNTSESTKFHELNGHLEILLPTNEQLNPDSIKVNNHSVSSSDISISTDNNQTKISIKMNLKSSPNTVTIDSEVKSINVRSFEYQPQYVDDNLFVDEHNKQKFFSDFNPIQATFKNEFIAPDPGKVTISAGSNIKFGKITNFNGQLLTRNEPDEITPVLNVTDTRTKKATERIMLNYSGGFKIGSKPVDIPLSLEYYDSPNHHDVVSNNIATVETTKYGEAATSIKWKKTQGLRIRVGKYLIPTGEYHVNLCWSHIDGPH